MGEINLLAVVLGAAAFFAVGAVWYTALFGKLWQRESGVTDEMARSGNMPLTFGLCFLFELLIATVLWHLIARTGASDVVVMMMASGFGAAIMTPAIGINYLYQQKSGTLFAIDAGHFIFGMAAMGAVFTFFN